LHSRSIRVGIGYRFANEVMMMDWLPTLNFLVSR